MRALSASEATYRVVADYTALTSTLDATATGGLDEHFLVHGGPLGDFCTTLHDLLAHVLMWDEIALAMLHELRADRRHWSLDPRWDDPAAGRALNQAGVTGGRRLPAELL